MKIFYSWQMDAPRKINKDFIFSALTQAVEQASEALDVSEAERERIEVDQDTQGVLGSPDVVAVILKKISESNLVVADVSSVATGMDNKKHINSNVAIELGFSYGKLGDEAVLKVMNTYYGDAQSLPFDLRTRRHPVQYFLAPDADSNAIAKEGKKLSKQLFGILGLYLDKQKGALETSHLEMSSTVNRGMFWEPNDVLIPEDRTYSRDNVFCKTSSLIYARCIPRRELSSLGSAEALSLTAHLRPLYSHKGFSPARNRWGAISYSLGGGGEIFGFTQIFRNRELWAVDCILSNRETEADGDEVPKRFIPSRALHDEYSRSIDSIRKKAEELQYGEAYLFEIGVTNASGLHIAIDSRHWDSLPGPIFADDIVIRKTINNDTPTAQILNDFWQQVFSEAGCEVPDELRWEG